MDIQTNPELDHLLAHRAKGKTFCFVSGNFNIIHPGHMRFLLFAAEQADYLIVGLNDIDSSIGAYFSNGERAASLNALNFVDCVIVINNDLKKALEIIKPEVVVKGKEFELIENEELDIIQPFNGKLLFSSGEKQFSSRELVSRQANENSAINQAIQKFHQRYHLDKTHLLDLSLIHI